MQQTENKQKPQMPQEKTHKGKRLRILLVILAVVFILAALLWNNVRMGRAEDQDGQYSEEQAQERLRTLEEALQQRAPEVVPMQFFQEEFRPDSGTISITAVTTMPEDQIAAVSFSANAAKAPDKKVWYEAESQGNGYYTFTVEIRDLGNREGKYTVQAYITPKGGSETEAGTTAVDVTLENYLYSEALGDGVQSLVLVNPVAVLPEEETEEETAETTPEATPRPTVTPKASTTPAAEEKAEIEKVRFKVWTQRGGQEDITVYEAEEAEEGIWAAEVHLDEFEDEGDFTVNAYAVIENTEIGVASDEFELLPDPVEVPTGDKTAITDDTGTYMEVPEILQNPELPTGCESVAATIALNSLGYELEKTEIATNYLERGSNFAISYVGDPFSQNGAGCFPPAIVRAINKFLIEQGDSRRAHDITGTSLEDLCTYVDNGIPAVVWASIDMQEPRFTGAAVSYHGRRYEWYRSEHCVVFYGYNDEEKTYLISDPLAGLVERDQSAFERIYGMTGSCAVVIY